jgi:hypothetical protein
VGVLEEYLRYLCYPFGDKAWVVCMYKSQYIGCILLQKCQLIIFLCLTILSYFTSVNERYHEHPITIIFWALNCVPRLHLLISSYLFMYLLEVIHKRFANGFLFMALMYIWGKFVSAFFSLQTSMTPPWGSA